eukprot:SAG11_NODE_3623_length_2329_cov_13.325561_3_plen_203_part_00
MQLSAGEGGGDMDSLLVVGQRVYWVAAQLRGEGAEVVCRVVSIERAVEAVTYTVEDANGARLIGVSRQDLVRIVDASPPPAAAPALTPLHRGSLTPAAPIDVPNIDAVDLELGQLLAERERLSVEHLPQDPFACRRTLSGVLDSANSMRAGTRDRMLSSVPSGGSHIASDGRRSSLCHPCAVYTHSLHAIGCTIGTAECDKK